MQSAYIARLNREMLVEVSQQQAETHSLCQRFIDWYASLPEITRDRPFAMLEFEKALGTQGRHLSPILLHLGWRRRRKWTGAGHYPRFWMPPSPPSE
jgi:hypothetical protein